MGACPHFHDRQPLVPDPPNSSTVSWFAGRFCFFDGGRWNRLLQAIIMGLIERIAKLMKLVRATVAAFLSLADQVPTDVGAARELILR